MDTVDDHIENEHAESSFDDKVTRPLLHFSYMGISNAMAHDTHSQMIACHNAETEVCFLPGSRSNSSDTVTSSYDTTTGYYKPKVLQMENTSTTQRNTPSIHKGNSTNSIRSNHMFPVTGSNELKTPTAVLALPSIPVTASRGITPSRQFPSSKPSCAIACTGMSILNTQKRDSAAETDPAEHYLTCTGINLLSISSAELKNATTAMSRLIYHSGTSTKSDIIDCQQATSTNGLTHFVDDGISNYDLIEKDSLKVGSYNVIVDDKSTEPVQTNHRSVYVSTSACDTQPTPAPAKKGKELRSKYVNSNTISPQQSKSFGQTSYMTPAYVKQMKSEAIGHSSRQSMMDEDVQYSHKDSAWKDRRTEVGTSTDHNLHSISIQKTKSEIVCQDILKIDSYIQYSGHHFVESSSKTTKRCMSTNTNISVVSASLSPVSSDRPREDPRNIDADIQCCIFATPQLEQRPEINSTSKRTNTEAGFSKSFSQTTSVLTPFFNTEPIKTDAGIQYSKYQEINEAQVQRPACIGRSQLMSVFSLSHSVSEAATQVPVDPPSYHEDKAMRQQLSQKVCPPPVPSAEMSHNTIGVATVIDSNPKLVPPVTESKDMGTIPDMTSVPAVDAGKVLLCGCAQFECKCDCGVEPMAIAADYLCPKCESKLRQQEKHDVCLSAKLLEYPQASLQRNLLVPKAISSVAPNRKHHLPPNTQSLNSRIEERLINLSQLIGKRASASVKSCEQMPDAVLSSKLNAAKWIKRCTFPVDKDYQSLLDLEHATSESLNHTEDTDNSFPISKQPPATNKKPIYSSSNSSHPEVINSVIPEPLLTLSTDSLADVLPTRDITAKEKLKDTKPLHLVMIDKNTSDTTIPKELIELELQTSPETRDAETEAATDVKEQKSASALTSRCYLPQPHCAGVDKGDCTDCLFVYDPPHCVVHHKRADAGVQIHPSRRDVELEVRNKQSTTDQSVGSVTSCLSPKIVAYSQAPSGQLRDVLSPRVYKALYETTKLVTKSEPKGSRSWSVKSNLSNSCGIDAEIRPTIFSRQKLSAAILTSSYDAFPPNCLCDCNSTQDDLANTRVNTPEKQSASVVTSRRDFDGSARCCCDMATQQESMLTFTDGAKQMCSACRARIVERPRSSQGGYDSNIGVMEECVKTHLVDSCRYYSNLLTKQIGRVRDNLTKHLAPPVDKCVYQILQDIPCLEACTMKPSGREELACQTHTHSTFTAYPLLHRPVSCCFLSPALSLTDICRGREKDLKSVYYMLTAIEGRIRRLKHNMPI